MAKDIIADLVAQISIDGTKFDKGMGMVNRQLKTVREELKTARSNFRQTGDSADFLANRSQTLSGKLKLQESRLELLNKAYKESVDSTGEFSKRSQNLATQLEKAKRELSETEAELKDVNEELRNLPNRWQVAGDQAQAAGEKMMNAGRNMTNFGRNMTYGVTLPIVAAAGSVFKLAMDWETAFTGVEKTVDATTQELDSLEQGLRNMAKEIPASTTEIAAVAEAAGQLGIQTSNIEEFSRVMIDLGNTTNLSADQAATTFARFANIVGMSQEDFDKLGSTVVDLGNNLATTEAEITEMALRLAGAGSQIGLSEAQILAFAGALSSVGIEAEAGGSAFSRVMIDMANSVATTDAKLVQFAEVAGMSAGEFKKAFEEDAAGALMSFISGLGDMSAEGENTFGILEDLGLSEIRVRDALLRASGASDVFTEALNIGSKAWEENTALTEEAEKRYGTTASQLEILWNRLKDTGITLGESLVPALMDALDAAEPLIEQIESGAKAFSEMDEEQQRTILKMIAMAAVAGPAIWALGGITTGIGGIVKVGGGLASLLGKVGGVGLLGRIAGLGVTGPVGLAIGGVAALGAAMIATKNYFEETNEATFETVRQMNEEIQATDKLIVRFEELQKQNRLTTDEMLEYMDILDDLSSTSSPEKIAELRDRQAELLEKSGYTNDEMDEFLELNDNIIAQAPNATEAISDQGNAYADNLSALKELNEAKREEMMMVAERELMEGLRDEAELLLRQTELEKELVDLRNQRSEAQSKYTESLNKEIDIENEIAGIEAEMLDLQSQGYDITDEKMVLLAEEIGKLKDKRSEISKETEQYKEQLDDQEKKLNKKDEELEKIKEELKRLDDLKYEYEALWLAQLDINAEKGKGIQAIDEEIARLRDSKRAMEENTDEALKNTEEYRNAKEEIDNQVARLLDAKEQLEQINKLASETAYDKTINIHTNPSIARINQEIADTVYKRVNVGIDARYAQRLAYAEGTDYHPGGQFLAGEEGPELGRLGNRWEMLDFGTYNRPTGYQVFTHEETKRILSSLMPAYAEGTSPSGETNRIVNQLNGHREQPQQRQIVIQQMVVRNDSDIKKISNELYWLEENAKREDGYV